MNKLILTAMLSFTTCLTVFGQEYVYIKDDKYETTKPWVFTWGFEVRVAKDSKGDYLIINSNRYIKGTLRIFLSDGSVIKCLDTGKKDKVNNSYTTLFKLTKTEIETLKQVRIQNIRYTSGDNNDYIEENVKEPWLLKGPPQLQIRYKDGNPFSTSESYLPDDNRTYLQKMEYSCGCYATEYYISYFF